MEHTPYSFSLLRELLDYNPETGMLTWKHRASHHFAARHPDSQSRKWNAKYAGKPAFKTVGGGGYLSATIFQKRMMAHRVAWCIYHGVDIASDNCIDHINGFTNDNRISNLRISSAKQNMQNAKKRRDGLRGAFFHKSTKKYQASIRLHLGTFDTEEEANAAYERAAKMLHGAFYLPNGSRATASRIS